MHTHLYDISDNRLYWCDTSKKYASKIETSLLDGSNRRVLISSPGANFFGVAILQAQLFYTVWNQKYVQFLSGFTYLF